MTTILLWAVFIALFLLVVLAPIARWFARRGRGAAGQRKGHGTRE